MLVAILVLAVLYTMVYRGGSGVAEGARFGALIGVFVVCAFVLHNYMLLNIGLTLTLMQAVAYFIQWTVVGTMIGLLYGGIFFKAKDAPALQAWYKRHLGIDVQPWGGTAFSWAGDDGTPTGGTTIWSVAPESTEQFAPGTASFMINYRVDDLHALVAALRAEGCNVLDKVDDSEYGKFGWVVDPEGNKVELWQPPAGQ
jgi:predicted enzyme related to lactoylglutathione lyase